MPKLASTLSSEEKSRYLRHILLADVGEAGQLSLKNSSVLCIGAGGLGSSALLYLAAAGVGRIGIVDSDIVDASNLQRQVLYQTSDIGMSKAKRAKERLIALNPLIEVESFSETFNADNAEKLLSSYDAILDGTDNFSTRYLVNDVAIKLGKPNFFGCIYKFTGQVAVFGLGGGCYRCLFPSPPSPELAPDCARAGVLGVLPGLVGTYQALEFLKWRIGIGEVLSGKLMMVDTLGNSFRTLNFEKNPTCSTCLDPSKIELASMEISCKSDFPKSAAVGEMTVQELSKRMLGLKNFVLVDVRDPVEYEIGNLGGILIPLDELQDQLHRLPKTSEIIVHCRSGGRSAKACELLSSLGYARVVNVVGGIVAWQKEIDHTVKT